MFILTMLDTDTIYGPFKTADEAAKFAMKNHPGRHWAIRPLSDPEEF